MAEMPPPFELRDEAWIDNAADRDYFGYEPEAWAGGVEYEESASGTQLLVDEGSGEDRHREGTLDRPAAGSVDYSAHSATHNIVAFFSWIANMSDEATLTHSRYWGRMSLNLTGAANALRWRGAVLSNAWSSPAKERFFAELGGALYSMEEWADIAAENQDSMVRLAGAISDAQREIAKVYRYYLLTEHLRTAWWNPLAQQWFGSGAGQESRAGSEGHGGSPGFSGLPMPVFNIGGRSWEPNSVPSPSEIVPLDLLSPDMDRVSDIASRSAYAAVGDTEDSQRLYHAKAAEIVERLAGVYVDLGQAGFRDGREFQGPEGLNPSPGGQPPGPGGGFGGGFGSGGLGSVPDFGTPDFGDFGWDEGGFGPDGDFGYGDVPYDVGDGIYRMRGTHGAELLAFRSMLRPQDVAGLDGGGHLAGLPVADVAPRMPGMPVVPGPGTSAPGGIPPGAGGFPMLPTSLAPPGSRAARQHMAAVDGLRSALAKAQLPGPGAVSLTGSPSMTGSPPRTVESTATWSRGFSRSGM
jgi:hypothetical protein